MKKKASNTYSTIATSINDFILHRLNKIELYEVLVNCVMESTNEEKDKFFEKDSVVPNEYQVAKNWLNRM